MTRDVFAIVLAGGEGKRLAPLTLDRAKPAVPFGGNYRLIDFALSNLVNAGFRRIVVLTQYKSHSLDRHIAHDLARSRRCSATTSRRCPRRCAAARTGSPARPTRSTRTSTCSRRAAGLRDRVRRRPHLPHGPAPDGRPAHRERGRRDRRGAARAARPGRPVRRHRDGRGPAARSARFREKPTDAVGLPDAPDQVYASMGNYVFSADALRRGGGRGRGATRRPRHDMGGNIDPDARRARRGAGLRLLDATRCPGATERDRGYWRDVGTLDAFYDAHMDLISVDPIFNLYNREWPILTWPEPLPPAKFVFADEEPDGPRAGLDGLRRRGRSRAARCAGRCSRPSVHVHSYARGRATRCSCRASRSAAHAVVQRAILDKDVRRRARARGSASTPRPTAQRFTVSDGGIVVVPQGRRRWRRDARRAAHARVPAGGLRRGRRARRVPGARARAGSST